MEKRSIFPADSRLHKFLAGTLLFVGLTVLSQVGGLILLVCWHVCRYRLFTDEARRWLAFVSSGAAYVAITLLLVPGLAALFGRVPMPLFASAEAPVAPRSLLYCLLNRHYVKPQVRDLVIDTARRMAEKYPGSHIHYMDGGFPYGPKFPLLPHLSHADGRKIDLSFCYHSGGKYSLSPSPLGYWVYEPPKPDEPAPYKGKPSPFRWDMPFLQGVNRDRKLDEKRTRDLLKTLLEQPGTEKILLEIHLQERLKVSHPRLRFQQRQAARHDDHLHLQVK
jgi:hypothetical protein